MYGDDDPGGRRRVGAAAATLAIHAGIAAVLIWGLAERGSPPRPDAGLTTVDLSRPPPPPSPSPQPSRAAAKDVPAPQGKKAEASPREAPQVALPLPVPAPAARVAGAGAAANAGAGSGAGGAGNGSGGGGDGGLGSPAVHIAGALRDSDYPREAEGQGLAGTVAISFRVRSDGSVDRCRVVRSSGAALLDDLTCRLFTQRFRFRPATNTAGQAVDSNLSTSFTWGTRRRR